MQIILRIAFGVFLVGLSFGYNDPHFETGRYGIVHLFEWHWDTIADECEQFLGPNKVGGVQISPPTENRAVDGRPWWERYQPVSYGFTTRSGDEASLIDMIHRCNAVGVRIYADAIFNHMCGMDANSGIGTGGSYYDANSLDFPAVPYTESDFHLCNLIIDDYQDAFQVRECRLFGLLDLDQAKDSVKGKIVGLMNKLISFGVAGFRIDACKYMHPDQLANIFDAVNDLESSVFGTNQRPFIYQEVIDQGEDGEAIKSSDYSGIAPVTEFKYGKQLATDKNSLGYLQSIGENMGMLPSDKALVFINNHDNQRGHGAGGTIVEFQDDPYDLKILTAYMLAYPYGIPRVMSSYYFSNADQGPPSSQRVVNADGSCGNGWACEHRWPQIANMFEFGAVVKGEPLNNWWSSNGGNFAFNRGGKGFIAANKVGVLDEWLYTGLPDGTYCDVISGSIVDGVCTGTCHTVIGGYALVVIDSDVNQNQVVALHVNAMTDQCVAYKP